MVQKIPDEQKAAIIDRYKQGLKRAQITSETGVPIGSVNRIISQYRHSIKPETIATEAQSAIAQVVTQSLKPKSVQQGVIDTDGALISIINAMLKKVESEEVKPRSSDACAAAATRAIALYRQFHPQTMEELADQLLALPDFEPGRFIQVLRKKIEGS